MVKPDANLPAAVPSPRTRGPRVHASTRGAARPPRAIATVVQVLIAPDPRSLVSGQVDDLVLDLGGVVGDRHHGPTRPSGSREARYYPRGTVIRNRRQVTIVSCEELAEVATRAGLPELDPGWLGANLMVTGVDALSTLPAGTRLLLHEGAGLVCEGVNQPCSQVAHVVAARTARADVARGFVRAAFGRRGVVATVEHPGVVRAGDVLRVVPPEVHTYPV